MPPDTAAALVSFAFATSITPGPNNIMLTASGVNFGFARTIPHMLGIGAGFMALLVAIGLGVGMVFAALPQFGTILKLVGAAYMLWLAWKVAHAVPLREAGGQRSRPMTFLEAAAFQWVNPKAWVMALGAMAVYVRPDHAMSDIIAVTLVFGAVNVPSVGTWAAFGHALRDVLREPRKIRIFNIVMALLLVASLLPIVATDLPIR
jgi:threonine/homoserine/homoserine lactone efflux protein